MFNCFSRTSRVESVLSPAFAGDRHDSSIVLKDDSGAIFATFPQDMTIHSVLQANPSFDAIIERKVSNRDYLTWRLSGKAGREEAKIQEVAKTILPLVDSVIQRTVRDGPENPHRVTVTHPCNELNENRLKFIAELCLCKKYISKGWCKRKAPYIDAALMATSTASFVMEFPQSLRAREWFPNILGSNSPILPESSRRYSDLLNPRTTDRFFSLSEATNSEASVPEEKDS